ncbi:MAG: hypothetical protein IKE35_07165 [Lachnospiraceae bacterium]|nr:hypothetical protein [Lachnospiraceae bacterium]
MIRNRMWEEYKAGKPAIGTFHHLNSSQFIDAVSYTGLDWIVIDMEHTALATDEMDKLVALAEARGMSPVVRVNSVERSAILKALDAGAHALMVPCIKTMEQIHQIIEWGKFKPLGDRGFCPTRDCGYGMADNYKSMTEYLEWANENTILMPQCETKECVEIIDEVTATEGIDAIFIGPMDLSVSLGVPGDFTNPIFLDAIAKILAACKKNNVMCTILAGSIEQARAYLEQGYDGIAYNVDLMIVQNAFKDIVNGIKAE